MKKFIRYLYEYQNGKKVHNVGFVKVECNDCCEVVQIYGKGFPNAGNQEFEVFVFYMMGEMPVGISMGTIKSTRPMFGYRLEYTPEDVGGREIFEAIDGIILSNDINGFRKWYAAVWDEKNVPVEQMTRREEILRQNREFQKEQKSDNDAPPAECEETESAATVIEECTEAESVTTVVEEHTEPADTVVEEHTEPADTVVEECTEPEPAATVVEECTESEPAAAVVGECTESEPDDAAIEEYVEPEPENIAAEEREEEISESEQEFTQIFKITRKDLAQLPRREWRLANNNFLLHGYYNYHHLVSFEKDNCCWLGVPGIYHPKEQKAADAFGFGQFMKPDEGEIDLAEGEMNPDEDFGYWCRKVGAVIHG